MKALIKKYPINARYESENEVWEETRWTPMMNSENLEPYINEDYGYALCEGCPEDVELTVEMFDVTEHIKTVKDDMSGEDVEVKYWMAEYIGGVEDGA